MDHRELKDCMQSLAERYQLQYLEEYKRFVGFHRGIGVNACEHEGVITLAFFSPSADIDISTQIIEDFGGFGNCAEAGLPTNWIEVLKELDVKQRSGLTRSHRGCVLWIDKYRLKLIGIEKLMEIPEIVARDLYEYGATESWVCDNCSKQSATDAFLDGVYASLCNRCWQQAQLILETEENIYCSRLVRKWIKFAVVAAIIILVAVIFRSSPGPESYIKGVEALERNDYDLAITYFTEAIQIDPQFEKAWCNRGVAHLKNGDYDEALTDYTKAIHLDPKDYIAYSGRGYLYFLKDENDKAISDCTEAIRLDPKMAVAYYNRGLAYADKKNYDEAISDYSKVINIDPLFTEAYYERGMVLCFKGRYEPAISEFSQAIKLNPEFSAAYNFRGGAYLAASQYDKSITDFTRALEIDPEYPPIYSNRASAYYFKGEYDKAWDDIHKAQSMDCPVDPEFLKNLRQASGREK
jgi:tetratricopeptide (TPR) repeat protein